MCHKKEQKLRKVDLDRQERKLDEIDAEDVGSIRGARNAEEVIRFHCNGHRDCRES